MEYNLNGAPASRLSRFAAASGGSANTPLAMADSGHQWYGGIPSYNVKSVKAVYKTRVDNELGRPPKADLSAVWERVGNQVRFSISITNRSGTTLSTSNSATLHAIIYEDKQELYTSRIARAAESTSIVSLADGASASYTLQTSNLTGVDWSKLHYIVLADYRPGGASGPYDMLQAAVADQPSLDTSRLVFMVDPADSQVYAQRAIIAAVDGLSWSVTPSAAWIGASSSSGMLPTQPGITVNKSQLVSGWQTGSVNINTGGGSLIGTVEVKAYYGTLEKLYVPVVRR